MCVKFVGIMSTILLFFEQKVKELNHVVPVGMQDLTEFQKVILHILSSGSMYGLAVKRDLESYYDTEINHGRLYPNLDHLVEANYVEKASLDERTNEYKLTKKGEQALIDDIKWELRKYAEQDPSRREELTEIIEEITENPEDD